MLIGYARASAKSRELGLQLNALALAGCEKIFQDNAIGTRADRPGFDQAMAALQSGDLLVVWKLNRVGRSLKHLVELAGTLRQQGVEFRSLADGINTSSPYDRSFFNFMDRLAEMERDLIVERTSAGRQAARANGRAGGRRRKMTDNKLESARKLLDSGRTPTDVARSMGISLSTLYRWLPAQERASRVSMRKDSHATFRRT